MPSSTAGPHREWLCGNCAKFFSLATRNRLFPKRMQGVAADVPCAQQSNPMHNDFVRSVAEAVLSAAFLQQGSYGQPILQMAPAQAPPQMVNMGFPQPMDNIPPVQPPPVQPPPVQPRPVQPPPVQPPPGKGHHRNHRRGRQHHRGHGHRSSSRSSSSGDWERTEGDRYRNPGRSDPRNRTKVGPGFSVVVHWADVGGVTSSFVCLRVAGR